jgi:hypothetical protein
MTLHSQIAQDKVDLAAARVKLENASTVEERTHYKQIIDYLSKRIERAERQLERRAS